MFLCLSYLTHLLVIIAVTDVIAGTPLAFLLLTDAPFTRANVDHSGVANRLENDIKPADRKEEFKNAWTRILQNPPDSLEVTVGSRVELQCEVVGGPPPEIYWITGNEPERQIQELTLRAQQEINFMEWNGASRISSTYVIDCVRPEDQGLKYCVSVSGNAVVISAATVLLVNSTRSTNCSDESPPTVIFHASWRFALQQSTVILPCRVAGWPKPKQRWLDVNGNKINETSHERYTPLPNGDLKIINLEWKDMGQYICRVSRSYTEKRISTFLYPTRSQ